MVEYPWLSKVSRVIDQVHEFLNLINGGVLWLGLAIALLDLLTGGILLASQPWLLWVWAASQAIGVDSFLYHFSAKVREHMGAVRYDLWRIVPAIATLAVVAGLAYVSWQAGYLFNFVQVEHTDVNGALTALGWTTNQWLGIRAGISVLMVILSGFTRYAKTPSRAVVIASSVAQSGDPQPQIAPAVLPSPQDVPTDADETPYYREPGGEWAPILAPAEYVPVPDSYLRRPRDRPKPALRNPGKRGPAASVEAKARKAWDEGARTKNTMMDAAGISSASAQKYIERFKNEATESEAARQPQTEIA